MSEPVNEQDRCDVGPPDEHLKELLKHSKQLESIIDHLKRLEALCVTMFEERFSVSTVRHPPVRDGLRCFRESPQDDEVRDREQGD